MRVTSKGQVTIPVEIRLVSIGNKGTVVSRIRNAIAVAIRSPTRGPDRGIQIEALNVGVQQGNTQASEPVVRGEAEAHHLTRSDLAHQHGRRSTRPHQDGGRVAGERQLCPRVMAVSAEGEAGRNPGEHRVALLTLHHVIGDDALAAVWAGTL